MSWYIIGPYNQLKNLSEVNVMIRALAQMKVHQTNEFIMFQAA